MEWGRQASSPFSPDADLAAQDAAGMLLRTGAFWFNNGILLPDETPSNWPFHLKDLELWTVREKAKRVGLGPNDAAGYVCNTGEAHEFCIRALRQEIRRSEPTAPVTLLASSAAHPGVRSAAEMLGLRLIQIPCGLLGEVNITALDAALSSITDAVIAAATWRNQLGGFDDIRGISTLLNAHRQRTGLPALLHLDAARCFDDVTTLSLGDRRRLDLPGLSLGTEDAGADKDMVKVATIAAGGVNINGMGSELVVALKPRALGAVCGQFIECVAGRDDTICGSRDALAGASMAIHEARFRVAGLRRVAVRFDARGLDLIIEAKLTSPLPTALFDRWGARRLSNGDALLQVTPWAGSASVCQLLSDLGICRDRIRLDRSLRAMRLSTFEYVLYIRAAILGTIPPFRSSALSLAK
ncbi:hypothetical protein E8E13_001148 [Curvularia kusanoi]|uniref:Uncharacterized protein n=1 Tax=Curvularia kusanoi TaxID=90978 RepID=A0A9P4W5Q7_CURKU|nr:hypothetical protein E8E13_001148 [Curvularia kusanoi]